MKATKVSELLPRGLWALDRFGLSPKKLPARLGNRSQPRILSVSIPKSGTHLVERALCLHPRLYRRVLPTVKSTNLDRWGDLDQLLGRLRPGQVAVAHLPYQPGYPEIIARRQASALFLIRDPRDVVVSEAHYVIRTPSHRAHELFARQPTFKDALLLVIRGDREHGWLPFAEKLQRYEGWLNSGALVIRFEDLIGSAGGGDESVQRSTIESIFEHIGVPVERGYASRVADRLFSKKSPTFRKGAIGGWRDAFDQEVAAEFEQQAAMYMPAYGYPQAG